MRWKGGEREKWWEKLNLAQNVLRFKRKGGYKQLTYQIRYNIEWLAKEFLYDNFVSRKAKGIGKKWIKKLC